MEAELAGPVTILTHAELLGQAERGRNQREAPRSAGRCTVGDSDGPQCNRIRGACKRGATRNTHVACSRRADPPDPEAADPLHLPPVAGCRRCEAPDRLTAGCMGGIQVNAPYT